MFDCSYSLWSRSVLAVVTFGGFAQCLAVVTFGGVAQCLAVVTF